MKIFGVANNYNNQEGPMSPIGPMSPMGPMSPSSPISPISPILFTKTDSSLLKDHKPFFIPDDMGQIDYEGNLVVRICRLGKGIPERFAHRYYDAVTVGIDFTARDLQRKAQKEGLPWTLCKGFDGSACIGDWLPVGPRGPIPFLLAKNGTAVQQGSTDQLCHSIDQLIAYISQFFTLKTGDLLFTGSPAGAGPANIGDHLQGYIGDQLVLDIHCK